jgi:hypothetical protein|tara:strand:- start:292 stop:468 length:177 start_codon:yes stop_codon:yes gene_type:complete
MTDLELAVLKEARKIILDRKQGMADYLNGYDFSTKNKSAYWQEGWNAQAEIIYYGDIR